MKYVFNLIKSNIYKKKQPEGCLLYRLWLCLFTHHVFWSHPQIEFFRSEVT